VKRRFHARFAKGEREEGRGKREEMLIHPYFAS